MRWDRNNVRVGMFVTSTDGEKIGKVIRCGTDTFVVEKGVLFPKDYELRYDHVTEISGNNISYALAEAIRREGRAPAAAEGTRYAGPAPAPAAKPEPATPLRTAAAGLGATATAAAERAPEPRPAPREAPSPEPRPMSAAVKGPELAPEGEEIRIPLSKEELDVERVSRETGHVRIHKVVKVEEKHFTVPITREEVIIEHVPAAAGETTAPATSTFQEQVVDLPLHEEELRVSKHPVLREEMIVRTVARSVEKEASATLRREEVEVEDTRPPAARQTQSEGYTTPGLRH